MTDTYLRIVPANRSYVPPQKAQLVACTRLREALPMAEEVSHRASDEIIFIDAGENFEVAYCPLCGATVDDDWWGEAMDIAGEDDFESLGVVMPCCKESTTLGDLRYEMPQAFARFFIEVSEPGVEKLDEALTDELSALLGAPLRLIWARY